LKKKYRIFGMIGDSLLTLENKSSEQPLKRPVKPPDRHVPEDDSTEQKRNNRFAELLQKKMHLFDDEDLKQYAKKLIAVKDKETQETMENEFIKMYSTRKGIKEWEEVQQILEKENKDDLDFLLDLYKSLNKKENRKKRAEPSNNANITIPESTSDEEQEGKLIWKKKK